MHNFQENRKNLNFSLKTGKIRAIVKMRNLMGIPKCGIRHSRFRVREEFLMASFGFQVITPRMRARKSYTLICVLLQSLILSFHQI